MMRSCRNRPYKFVPAAIVRQGKLVVFLVLLGIGTLGQAQEIPSVKGRLTQAVMCEAIREGQPVNAGWIFPVAVPKIHCLTTFEEIPETQFILHRWYFKDKPVATFRLALQAPRWSTFSSLQIRGMDKGPWRVVVTDIRGQLIKELRFSVTD